MVADNGSLLPQEVGQNVSLIYSPLCTDILRYRHSQTQTETQQHRNPRGIAGEALILDIERRTVLTVLRVSALMRANVRRGRVCNRVLYVGYFELIPRAVHDSKSTLIQILYPDTEPLCISHSARAHQYTPSSPIVSTDNGQSSSALQWRVWNSLSCVFFISEGVVETYRSWSQLPSVVRVRLFGLSSAAFIEVLHCIDPFCWGSHVL